MQLRCDCLYTVLLECFLIALDFISVLYPMAAHKFTVSTPPLLLAESLQFTVQDNITDILNIETD